ncbi:MULTISPECIES: hypothetical protein [Bacillus]|uniref:hypothetical protein n=1 Tax=Bacillus TaxID=1386 RepID=UPI00228219A3|nr:hypothetical protein [Bacillus pumilus]MCY7572462.1 hypothetical protein [Bacillus pumilus]MEC3761529.1 hypothetical protein [Bacillus pumilus]
MTYVNRRIPVDTTSEENAATFESDERTCEQIKTDRNMKRLIKALTENTDTLTTEIINDYLANERPTYASIGKRVGVHYKKVERVIKGLAKNYDASKYGDLSDYLAV